MSVSLALVPVALTLRLVMGKRNFSNWIDSMQDKYPTSFRNEQELVRAVHLAGYDTEDWGGSIKTHIDEKFYFFWETVEGKWTAVFDKSDDKAIIERFMEDINRAAGRRVFGEETLESRPQRTAASTDRAPSPAVREEARQEKKVPTATFPTNFRDGELLFRTLKEFGVNPTRHGREIRCKAENSTLTFRQSGAEGPYSVEVTNAPDLRRVYEYLSTVDDEYKRCVQAMVVEKLKERAADREMTVESEQVLEDNSVLLTLNVRR